MNTVSIKEAIGSAAKARAAGIAICAISSPNSSFLKTLLAKQLGNKMLDFTKSSLTYPKVTINLKNQKETDLLTTKKKTFINNEQSPNRLYFIMDVVDDR